MPGEQPSAFKEVCLRAGSALSLGALSAELNPVVCSRNFLENAPCIGFLHFFVLAPNSPFNTPWDYLLNTCIPILVSLSAVGNPARRRGLTWTPPDLQPHFMHRVVVPHRTALLGMAGPQGAFGLTHLLVHTNFSMAPGSLESQSPTWTLYYLEEITLFLETLVLFATIFVSSQRSHIF